MIRLRRSALIDREPAEVFALLSDLGRYPELFVGISRWEPRSRRRRGVGARFRVLMRVGSIEAGGTLAITEWKPNERIRWASEAGVEQKGGWRLEPAHGGTRLHLEIEYALPGAV